MTLEMYSPTESLTVIPDNENERLLLQRELAQRRLGRACAELTAASEEHVASIAHFIEINEKIRAAGLSGVALAASSQEGVRFYDDAIAAQVEAS